TRARRGGNTSGGERVSNAVERRDGRVKLKAITAQVNQAASGVEDLLELAIQTFDKPYRPGSGGHSPYPTPPSTLSRSVERGLGHAGRSEMRGRRRRCGEAVVKPVAR